MAIKNIFDRGLAYNTKISLLDGREVTIEELTKSYNPNHPDYVYTFKKDGISIGKVSKPKLIKKNAETIIVVLDNNKEICCTPELRFLMRYGQLSYKRAIYIKSKHSLMPIYKGIGKNGYENFYDPIKQKFFDTHRMVFQHFYQLDVLPESYEVHHLKSKTNNDPRELELLSKDFHKAVHDKVLPSRYCLDRFKGNLKILNKPELLLQTAMESISINDIKVKLNITNQIIEWTLKKHLISFNDFLSLIPKRQCYLNHKVIEVKPGPLTDVYNFSVKNINNYALSVGVFTSCF
jgi:hypothetical protein